MTQSHFDANESRLERGKRALARIDGEAVVIRVEERLVAAVVKVRDKDRPARFDAELVLAVLGHCRGEEIPGVQPVVTDKFVKTAVERI